MGRFLILFISIFMGIQAFGQDTISKQNAKKYISLKVYKSKFGKVSDSTKIIYRNGDTLVNVPMDFDPFDAKTMVKVRYEPKDSIFLNTYKEVVYNTDIKIDSSAKMRYWKGEIKIFFDKSVPVSHSKELMKFTQTISKDVDSLEISRNFEREKANYLVYYLNRKDNIDYDPRIVGKTGGYYISWNGKSQIYDGKLKINTEKVESEKLQLNLLKYHFFKSLGHFKSSKDLQCESFLSACRNLRTITENDIKILKYHYSYGVCKGQTLKTFSDQTQKMQEILEKDPNAQLFVIHHE